MLETITVKAERTYPVLLVNNAVQTQIQPLFAELSCQKVLLVHAKPTEPYLPGITTQLMQLGLTYQTLCIPDGEAGKTAEVILDGWKTAAAMQLERGDLILTCGGGAVTDVGGFLAATWLRGIKLVHIPTSLLGMVDAAIGGKTAINTLAGKNLVGSFYSPHGVIVDPQLLKTLPRAEFTSGLAEIIKCGFIADPIITQLLESPITVASPKLPELIYRAIKVKAQIVSEDFHETGLREILNYGHTLGHALEKISDYQLKHGEAVAIGMVFAAQLSLHLNETDPEWVEIQKRTIETQGLPTSWENYPSADLLEQMRTDKKVRAGRLRFVLSDRKQTRVKTVDIEAIQAVLEGTKHGN